jgi:predicted helicase
MKSTLQQALKIIRDKASNDKELGDAFEKLSKVFLENDATQTQEYSEVWTYTDWAKNRKGYSDHDIGIDLVAELRDGSGYCAVQCKCYQPEHPISKTDLDSFISASSTSDFTRLLLIDTSTKNIGKNAQSVFDNLDKDYLRIQLEELEQSRIDWLTYITEDRIHLRSQKELRDHQIQAVQKVKKDFEECDRGKLIMACGTGKTFTSLKIAEELAGKGKIVLYMVPSLSLMSQTVREWKNDALDDFTAFSACSDIKIGKRSSKQDLIEVSLNDLAFPATTDPSKLSEQIQNADKEKMTVVFSTYHSIDVISEAQFKYDLTEFDLIICDEAHRTTGATLIGDDESNFVRIHSNDNVRGKKRLYMTATPRIFGETAKKKADEGEVALASMDDEETFGKTLFYRGFGWAVENNLLTDFKVVVLAVDEGVVSAALQGKWEESGVLKLDDATKMVGCYKALAKVGFKDSQKNNSNGDRLKPMKRALAFCQNIELSKIFAAEFTSVVNEYISNEEIDEKYKTKLKVDLFHVDGTFNAEERNERLGWLKDDPEDNICRVLTNVRCLAEGVDVPALDAIMFLHPRKSQIDVVQGVGRVMRKAEGKDLGYVILPITVAAGVSPEKALRDNEKYKVVWQILNALRAHDERFDSTINRIGLGEDVSDRIEIVGVGGREELDATTAVIEDVKPKGKKGEQKDEEDTASVGEQKDDADSEEMEGDQLAFVFTDLSQAIKAKIVEKCGSRDYWENWANDIAKIAQLHITRINGIVLNSGTPERKAFLAFLEEIQDDLNPTITETDAVEMLAQHIITKPVFDALFKGNKFTSENAVSKSMQIVIHQISQHNIEAESESLGKFYASVKRRADDIVTTKGRQKLVLELYDRFFKNAFPSMARELGIVYTPIEIVDFIIYSVNEVLKKEFKTSLGDKNVHILDPFSGTGTFITRLMQLDLIPRKKLPCKYKNEIHANEIVLLAYYISCINIESVYQDLIRENEYHSFPGMVMTDTFQLSEIENDEVQNLMPQNSSRREKQKKISIKVIIGNPPYSVQNKIKYPKLDNSIKTLIVDKSNAKHKSGLYDSYYRAMIWAASNIDQNGVISFVINNSWIEASIADAFRSFLSDNFSHIYCIDLKGNIRKSRFDKAEDEEGQNVFGSKSQNGIAIIILIKKKDQTGKSEIYYKSIGSGLSTQDKLLKISEWKSVPALVEKKQFQKITPNKFNDWINPRLEVGSKMIRVGDKTGTKPTIFKSYTSGVKTNRDEWAINFSKETLAKNMSSTISYYEKIVDDPKKYEKSKNQQKKIKWDGTLENSFRRGQKEPFDPSQIRTTCLRPFVNSHLYFSELFNNSVYLNHKFFPNGEKNIAIGISGIGARTNFSALVVTDLPNYDFFDKTQFFPKYIFSPKEGKMRADGLVSTSSALIKTSNICSDAVKNFGSYYNNRRLYADDLFHYVYALFNCEQYLKKFSTILGREMPPIPFARFNTGLNQFIDYGKKLVHLHGKFLLDSPFREKIESSECNNEVLPKDLNCRLRISRRKSFFSINNGSQKVIDNIPIEILNLNFGGKSAIEWCLTRCKPRKHKASGNIDDLFKHYHDLGETYPKNNYINYLRRVINVSIETVLIRKELNKLKIQF